MCQEHLCVLLIIRACHWAEAEQRCLCSANSAWAEVIENINACQRHPSVLLSIRACHWGEADKRCLCSANSAGAELTENSSCVSKASKCVPTFAHDIGVKLTCKAEVIENSDWGSKASVRVAYHSRMPLV